MSVNSFYDFRVKGPGGADYDLAQYKGKVSLVVNVASKCGYTPQYKGLEELFESFPKDKFVVLAFPCNQFGAQEPGSESEIQQFCETNYFVKFPILAKIDVNGENADPAFRFIKKEAPGILGTEMIKWNFTKFLIGKDGHVIKRYSPDTLPSAIKSDIEKALS